ncbi:XPG/Rad2 endonuclease, partial [Kipferlia bialata]
VVKLYERGIKPVFVFDGAPPEFKAGELAVRKERKEEAEAAMKAAQQSGDMEEMNKQRKRTVRVGVY